MFTSTEFLKINSKFYQQTGFQREKKIQTYLKVVLQLFYYPK